MAPSHYGKFEFDRAPAASQVDLSPIQSAMRGSSQLAQNYGGGPLSQAVGAQRDVLNRQLASQHRPQANSLQSALMGSGGMGQYGQGIGTALKMDNLLRGGEQSALKSLIQGAGVYGGAQLENVDRMRRMLDAGYDAQVKRQSSKDFERASRPSGGLLGIFGL